MKLQEIEKKLDVIERAGAVDLEILSVTSDSREVRDKSLFVALTGTHADGHDFINDALKRGASALIVENKPAGLKSDSLSSKTGVLVVPDTKKALAVASSCINGSPSKRLSVTGITGTNGKTTVTYLVDSIFRAAGFSTAVLGTINNKIGAEVIESDLTTPGSPEIQALFKKMNDKGISHCVMEVSSHAIDQERAWGTNFRFCVFTNLTHDHLDYHKNMDSYHHVKERLFTEYGPEVSIINIDDPAGLLIAEKVEGTLCSYALDRKADVRGEIVEESIDGITLVVRTQEGVLNVSSPLIGRHNAYNILAAIGVAINEGVLTEDIVAGIDALKCVPGRLERVEQGQAFSVLVDYAHTDDALKNVLTALRSLTQKKLITVFGCGGNRDREKRAKMARVAVLLSDYVVITSDNPRNEAPESIIDDVKKGITPEVLGGAKATERYTDICDRRKAIAHALSFAQTGDIVLLAGKGHEDYQIIGDRKFHFDDREEAGSILRSSL